MKRLLLILTLVMISCLLLASQATASDSKHTMGDAENQMKRMAHDSAGQAHQLDQKQIQEMQRLLQEKGYEVGSVDGVMSEETTEAIREFQEDEGLAQTGQADQKTLRALAPESDQQEFFGLSPEFGEMQEEASETKEKKSY